MNLPRRTGADNMVDTVTREARSRMMGAVRGKNTQPELRVRRAIHAAGFRYRLHRDDLPGRPDIVLPRYRTIVFVHGCFWHGHDCSRGKLPSSNKAFWTKKISGNVRRDRTNYEALRGLGWTVVTIWQCNLEKDLSKAIGRLRRRARNVTRLNAR